MSYIYKYLIFLYLMLSNIPGFCQVGISTDGSQPDPSAMLEVKSAVKGILPPRVALTAIDVPGPVVSPAIGLHVYNTDTAGIAPNNVVPGDYYWNGTRWIPVSPAQGKNHGDMLYWNGKQWVVLPAGSSGQFLVYDNGVPTWQSSRLPTILTKQVTGITETSAVCGGNVVDGGSIVTLRGICVSKSPDPIILDSNTIDDGGSGVFTAALTGLSSNTLYYVRATAKNGTGTGTGNVVSFRTQGCGQPITINHVASEGIAPVDKTIIYGTVSDTVGDNLKCWITSNLGADHQASAVNDSTQESAGWNWQFNKKQGFRHDGSALTPGSVWTTEINEDFDWQTSNDPCALEIGTGWRIPTYTEWSSVMADKHWINWNGPWSSALKLHAAGFLSYNDGSLSARGHRGVYWSSTQSSTAEGWYLTFIAELADMDYFFKAFGFPVRCVKD